MKGQIVNRFSRPYSLHHNYLTLLLQWETSHRMSGGSVPTKLFVDTEIWISYNFHMWEKNILLFIFSAIIAVWEGYVSCFVLGSQYWLGNSVSCMLPHNIRISGSNSVKNIIGNLIFIVFFTLISKSLRPVDCSLPGSSVHVISQASILEWVAISYSRRSSQPWSWNCVSCVSCIGRQVLYH